MSMYHAYIYHVADGKVVKRKSGAVDTNRFLQYGKDVIYPDQSALSLMTVQYNNGERSKDFLVNYISVLKKRGNEHRQASKRIL